MQFNKQLQNLTNYVELAVFHLNIHSLNCNHKASCQFLQLLETDVDVIILFDIWSTNIEFNCNILPGYSFHYQLSHESHIGGNSMFIKNTTDYKELSDYKLTKLPLGNRWIVLGKLAEQKYPCIIAGDLNIDLAKCNHNKETADYVETLITNNFMPTIILPTRITTRTSMLIDHIYYHESNKSTLNLAIKVGNFVTDLTDHLLNYLLLISDKRQEVKIRPTVRIFSSKNQEAFIGEIRTVDWTSVLDMSNANEAYDKFIEVITDSFERNFIQQKLSRKRAKDQKWITSGLKRAAKLKTNYTESG
jgi:hypothetical protein